MIESARELFVAQGYAATTMDQIAAQAGVAVQTLYYTFRTKGQLLCEVVEVTAGGLDASVPPMERSWAQEMLAAASAQRVLALAVEHGVAIYERVAGLWPAVTAAAGSDPYVDQYWQRVAAGRRAGQGQIITRIAELGSLRPGLDHTRATDVVIVLLGHDVYTGLAQVADWPIQEFKAWLFIALVQQLLEPSEPEPSATEDLSYGHLITRHAGTGGRGGSRGGRQRTRSSSAPSSNR
jgi:TetR/AcrR family transcriptional regulator of autoinduction and epiphytic fitness